MKAIEEQELSQAETQRKFSKMLITLTPVDGFVTLEPWADRIIPKTCESFAAVSPRRMPAGSIWWHAAGLMVFCAQSAQASSRG